ncbi:hypothetical protein JVU11DRAFT_1949 [Chiua virens]|nr:hypothetical protein JVU11DRAFT_1949 [Chiua virens]
MRRCVGGEDVPLRFIHPSNPLGTGRPYYVCNTHKWYWWADGLGHSPKTSPTATQPGELYPNKSCVAIMIDRSYKATLTGPQVGVNVHADSEATANTSRMTCAHRTCLVIRVAHLCQRCMCRKHCRSAGGCICDGHFITAETSLSKPVATPSPPLGQLSQQSHLSLALPDAVAESSALAFAGRKPTSLSQIDPSLLLEESNCPSHISSSSSSPPMPLSPPTSTAPSNVPAALPPQITTSAGDSSGNPRYMSHLRPLLVEHVAATHQRAELK